MGEIRNITIMHINPDEAVKAQVETYYKKLYPDAAVEICDLSNIYIKNCVGCWNCWVKTPGVCLHKDEMVSCYGAIINSDICVFSHQVVGGVLSGNSKTCMDRLIPLFHPYIKIIQGEMMHYKRYEKTPKMHYFYSLKEGEPELTQDEIQSIEGYYFRCNEHFRTAGMINHISESGEIVSQKTNFRIEPIVPESIVRTINAVPIDKSSKIAIYNGSPRGIKSNTMLLVEQFKQGLLTQGIEEAQIEVFHLAQSSKHQEIASRFYETDYHVFFMPLYVHSMPGVVKHFIDYIKPYEGSLEKKDSNVAFFVQSGFKEAYQSFYLRGTLNTICKHNNWKFAGCGIKGGMEGLRLMPPKANKKIYRSFNELGAFFARNGYLSEAILEDLIEPIRLSKTMKSAFGMLPNKVIQFYWNSQMKKNNVLDQAFAMPYKKR